MLKSIIQSLNRRRVVCASAILGVLIVLLWAASLRAQISPEEHASHHPEQAAEAAAAANDKGSDSKGGKGSKEKEGGMGGMMGGGGMGNMGKMMEQMGAPKEWELYPELMRLPDLPMEKRAEVQMKAHQRMRDGVSVIAVGVGELADTADTDDFAAMQAATDRIKEGLARFDSGLAAHRALAEGGEPRNVALQWFRKEMNLTGGGGFAGREPGMSAFHFLSMVVLIAFAALMLWMYFFKMRRAAALLEQLAGDAQLDPPAPAPAPAAAEAPEVARAENSPAKPPEFPAMRSRTEPVQKWSGKLRVDRILVETPTVKTLRLAAPDDVALPFTYRPGQFLTFTLNIGGKSVKRSYTIASTPTQLHYCAVTVKREDEGLVSKYLNDDVNEGDLLEVATPNGKFTFTGEEADSIVLIGGGVGITPLMSVIRYLTDIGWPNEIYLLYCCRTTDDFIFRQELEQLQLLHPNLHVFASMTREPGAVWMGLKGYFTTGIIQHLVPEIAKRRVHVCGPPPMMDAVTAMLGQLGVPEDRILTEAFGPAQKPPPPKAQQLPDAKATEITFQQAGKTAPLAPGQTVLDAAEAAGVDIDNSCRSGQCGLCKVKLLSGKVAMECDDSLSDQDKADGLILACQATATKPVTVDA